MADISQDWEYHMSPSRWSHRMGPKEVLEAHEAFIEKGTREAQWVLDVETDISYGTAEKQKMDIYTAKNKSQTGSPMLVFLHGGYWQLLGREMSGYFAPAFASAGATVVVIGYDLAPTVSLDEIVSEINTALQFLIKQAKERQNSGIYLLGHSAGAHLAATALAAEFSEEDAFDSELIKGAVLVSGVYDLRPLVSTSINKSLHLTTEDAWRLSPARFVDEIIRLSKSREIIFAVGECDPPEFRKQTGNMERQLHLNHIRTRYYDVPDADHFNVMEKLADPNYMLSKAVKNLLGLV